MPVEPDAIATPPVADGASLERDEADELQRLRKDQQAAAVVQARMFPDRELSFGDYQVGFGVWPAEALSGDFIDCVAMGDIRNSNRFGFLVADVAGHGTAAALVTVVLRSFMLRKSAQHNTFGPDELLAELNAELMQFDLDRYVCAIAGVVDTDNHTISLSSAGASPLPLLVRNGEPAEIVDLAGKALGLFADARFSTTTLSFSPGDRLTVATDGVLELVDADDSAVRHARLIQAAGASRGAFWEVLGAHPGTDAVDDVSVLFVDRQMESAQ